MKYSVLAMSLMITTAGVASAAPSERSRAFDTSVLFTGMTLTADTCDNSVNGGPGLSFGGDVVARADIDATIILKQNVKGTRIAQDVATATFAIRRTPGAAALSKNPTLGGAGGNPHIEFKWGAADDATETYQYVGRCVQGGTFTLADKTVAVKSQARGRVQAKSCGNDTTELSLNSNVSLSGVPATVRLSNNISNLQQQTIDGSNFGASVSMSDGEFEGRNFAQRFGVGGNPLVYMKFVVNGDETDTELYLGRCKELF